MKLITIITLLLCSLAYVFAASKDKPHAHKGVLEPYSGKPLPFKVSSEQSKKLDKGQCVAWNERSGKSGKGVVIQDVNASTTITMKNIKDLSIYPKVVPNVKGVTVYETIKFNNGTVKTGAKFDIGVLGMRFGYFLMLTHEPKFNTFTWTLDYSKNSDFDDNVGHWQVMKHPSKAGWTRVLYSCKVKLFPWIPEFVVNFLTKKALTESTGWVKKVSEAEQAQINLEEQKKKSASTVTGFPQMKFDFDKSKLPSWMNKIQGGFSLLSNQCLIATADTDTTIAIDSTTSSNNDGRNKSKNQHMENIIRSSARLAPFMRFTGRGGKMC